MSYNKKVEARRLFRAAVNSALEPFDIYGLGVNIPEASRVLIQAAEKFHLDMKEAEADDDTHKLIDL